MFGENYILAMGVKDIRGKFQKIAKLDILRAPVFGSNRLEMDNISFRSIFDHLFYHPHLIY